jgi:hypothetical protein
MSTMNPPKLTPGLVLLRLKAGQTVGLDEPGWGDTTPATCPDCRRKVMTFRAMPTLLYEYGVAYAHAHKCGELARLEDHPKWLQLKAAHKALDELAQQREEEWP